MCTWQKICVLWFEKGWNGGLRLKEVVWWWARWVHFCCKWKGDCGGVDLTGRVTFCFLFVCVGKCVWFLNGTKKEELKACLTGWPRLFDLIIGYPVGLKLFWDFVCVLSGIIYVREWMVLVLYKDRTWTEYILALTLADLIDTTLVDLKMEEHMIVRARN